MRSRSTIGLFLAVMFAGLVAWAAMGSDKPEPRTTPDGRLIPEGSAYHEVERVAPPARYAVDYARLDARIRKLMENRAMVGLAIGVVERGRISFLRGYGTTVVGGDEKVTPETVFRWASVSKGVGATMVAKLADEGKLSLDQPISSLGTSLRLPDGAETRASVRDVLSHRLGIYRNAYDNKMEEGQSPRDLRLKTAELTLLCEPGSCWSYQNIAFDAASEAVENLTGKSYGEALRDSLFGPLGMDSASVTRAGLQNSESWAHGHNGGPREIEVNDVYYGVPAAGGVNSNIKDMTVWMLAQMGERPNVVTPHMREELHSPLVFTPSEVSRMRKYSLVKNPRYGLGFRQYDYRNHRLVGHRGGVNGYRSLILFDPDLKSGVVALWNSHSSRPSGLQFEVMDMLFELPFQDWMQIDD